MTDQLKYNTAVLSTVVFLVPVICGFVMYKNLNKAEKLFLFYLFIGCVTDFSVMSLQQYNKLLAIIIFNMYSIFEPFFLAIYFYLIAPTKFIRKTCVVILVLLIPVWLIKHVQIFNHGSLIQKLSGNFYTWYQVVFAFIAAYVLLLMTQIREESLRKSQLWIVIGTFISTFCSFFLSSFLTTEYQTYTWVVYSFVNLLSYMVVTYAFLLTKEKKTMSYPGLGR